MMERESPCTELRQPSPSCVSDVTLEMNSLEVSAQGVVAHDSKHERNM